MLEIISLLLSALAIIIRIIDKVNKLDESET